MLVSIKTKRPFLLRNRFIKSKIMKKNFYFPFAYLIFLLHRIILNFRFNEQQCLSYIAEQMELSESEKSLFTMLCLQEYIMQIQKLSQKI